MITQEKRLSLIVLGVACLLLIPFIAMQFTNEVNWNAFDFIVAGALLLGAGVSCEMVLRKVKTWKGRLVLCGAVLFVLVLVWVELAVGIFGTPFAGN